MASRDAQLASTFVELADTLVRDFDVVEALTVLATRCVEVFGTDHAGLMLADEHGILQLTASSSHEMRALELFELQHNEGPCPDAFRSARPVVCDRLPDAIGRWPTFATEAIATGFLSAYAFPMRLRDRVIGALNLLGDRPGAVAVDDFPMAQALTDVATISILQHRAAAESLVLIEQLRFALNSRVTIEQAKGVVAEQLHIPVDVAFTVMRGHARDTNQRLVDVARALTEGALHSRQLG
jgi:GAF domain-containing protein